MVRQPDGTDLNVGSVTVNVRGLNLKFEGAQTYYVIEGTTEAALRDEIQKSSTVTELTNNLKVPYSASPIAGSYWLEFDAPFNSSDAGDHDYFVKVNYRMADGNDLTVKTLRIHVEDETVTSFEPPVTMAGIVPANVGPGAVVQDANGNPVTFKVNGSERFVSVGMLTDAKGNRVNTAATGVYENLTLTYNGQVICTDFKLTVTESSYALDYPQAGEPGYVGVDKNSTTDEETFADTGVANIQLSATGIPVNKGIDLIVVMDLSGSMKNGLDTNTNAPNFQESRIVAMEQALREMVALLQSSGADVRVAMSDFGDQDHFFFQDAVMDPAIRNHPSFDADHSNGHQNLREFFNFRNFVLKAGDLESRPYVIVNTKYNLANPSYTGRVIPTVYTGSGEVDADAFVDVGDLDEATMAQIIATMDRNVYRSIGTNYDIGLEYAYHLGYAIQQQNIAEGEDREIVCIFMSDGAAMQFNYFTGGAQSTGWADWITGNADGITSTTWSETNYPDQLNTIAKDLLTLLQNGKLTRPEYHRDGAVKGEDGNYYFKYRMRNHDGSGDVVTDVMMIVLRNTSSQDLQLARIRIEYPDFTAEFELSCLPAGEAAVLLERNRRSLPADEAISVRSENVVFFPELMDLQTQRIQITGGNGYLELTNLTDQDITGDILVYYKNSTSDLLYGGITYRERIQGGLEAGETIRILASNYLPDSCTILMVTCGD